MKKNNSADQCEKEQCVLILTKISGTDPNKECSTELFFIDKKDIKIKTKEIIEKIYEDFLEIIGDNNEGELDKKFCDDILKIIRNTDKINMKKVSYNMIYEEYKKNKIEEMKKRSKLHLIDKETGLSDNFTGYVHNNLIALDYFSSYDFYYYLRVEKIKNNKLEIIINEH